MQIANRKSSPAISWRSVSVGLIGVLFLCGLSPYNDMIVNNTFLVGNFMPVGMLLFFLLVVMLVNAPLNRWKPAWALSTRELIVAMSMTLVSCGLPGAGVMRYLPPQLVGVWNEGAKNPEYVGLLDHLQLPGWMFPSYDAAGTVDRGADPITQNYFSRTPGADDSLRGRLSAVPWAAWARPTVVWTFFTFTLLGAFICLLLIVRRQWVENERLPFPLATIYLSIIDPPEPGRAFNNLFRKRSFWIAFGSVFFIHSFNALHHYHSAYFPEIPVTYDLHSIFAEEPWVYLAHDFKTASLFFCVVGICYFLPSQISLSVWFFFLVFQITLMIGGSYRAELTGPMKQDQFFGALIPYMLALVWIGRGHWMLVIRQMRRGWQAGESRGRYLPYAAAGWGLVLFFSLGVGFLLWAGASLVGAIVCMIGLLTLHLAVARIVAETGMPFVNFYGNLDRPWLYVLGSGGGLRTTDKSYFLTQMTASIYSTDIRESPAVYASHALKLGDEIYASHSSEDARRPLAVRTPPDPARREPQADGQDQETDPTAWRRTIPFLGCLVGALVVGFFVAGAAKLYTEYNYAVTLDAQARPPDDYGTVQNIQANTLRRSHDYTKPAGPTESHSRVGHLLIGGFVSFGLSLGRLKSASFPFHPVGYLLAYTWPVSKIWFSMFVGWLLKTLLVRVGGIELYRRSREFFIGLILGDATVAAFWLLVSLVLNAMGLPYKGMFFLPP